MALLSQHSPHLIEAGCDEAGRGCLAGPVFAAAVILPKDFTHPILNDSKQLSEKRRFLLREHIEATALAWSICQVDAEEIDKINILNASIIGMQRAAQGLSLSPELLLIDGPRFHPFEIPHLCFIKGDSRYFSIAAASILAKCYRDEYMNRIHQEHPQYGWDKNKGYPTLQHYESIRGQGISPYHRKSFRLQKPQQLSLLDAEKH